MKIYNENVSQYLDSTLPIFLESWINKAISSEYSTSKESLKDNGLMMYKLVKKTISNTITVDEIIGLANKLAQERVEANINIGEFVYNVNLGRSEIIKYISQSGIPFDEIESVIESVNNLFDKFSYHAVTKYTEIRENELQEKISFIDQSHKERLTILGQMASTFVHEFRNPLTAVLGFIKLIQSDYPKMKYLDIINHELHQLNSRISQFLHVSKKEIIENKKSEFYMGDMFKELIEFLYASILDGEVEVTTDIDSSLKINANQDEIRQVFLNIILNSIDAVKNIQNHRRINITCNYYLDMIQIKIANNGPKIPVESITTIFEPFYTTKEFGTGIGLFVCKRIIEKHQGQIACTSDDDFTIFTIKLPVSPGI